MKILLIPSLTLLGFSDEHVTRIQAVEPGPRPISSKSRNSRLNASNNVASLARRRSCAISLSPTICWRTKGADGRYAGEAGTPERLELRRVFQERAKSYEFWVDNGLALVDSPDTVIGKIEEQHALIGHDVLCTQHGFGRLAPELVKKSMQLFGEKVIPAFA